MSTNKTERDWVRRISGRSSQDDNPETHGVDKTKDESPKTQSKDSVTLPDKTKDETKKGNGFHNVAGMTYLKDFATEAYINVLKYPHCAEAYGVVPPSILLVGPPGCGKTFFIENLAGEINVEFMKISPDDVGSPYIHGSQKLIAKTFREAKKKSPVILFMDEFDALVPKRTDSDNPHQNGEVNQFLVNMNNAADMGIFIVATTNRPECIDKAVLRAGRIDEVIYVDLPDAEARESLFRLSLDKIPTDDDIDYAKLAQLTQGYNFADITYLVKAAARKMFNATVADNAEHFKPVTQSLLEEVIAHKTPSVSPHDLRKYERMRDDYAPEHAKVRKFAIGFNPQ